MRTLLVSIGLLIVPAMAVAQNVPNATLCSGITCVIAWGGFNCGFVGYTIGVPVNFTVTEFSSAPLINGPLNYSSAYVSQSGTAYCSYPTSLLPTASYTVSTNNDSASPSGYTQVWMGQVGNWGTYFFAPFLR